MARYRIRGDGKIEKENCVDNYRIRNDGKIVTNNSGSNGDNRPNNRVVSPSIASVNNEVTDNRSVLNPYYNPSKLGHKNNPKTRVFAILLPILSLIIGQVLQYLLFYKFDIVLGMDLIFDNVTLPILIVSSVLCGISIIPLTYYSWYYVDAINYHYKELYGEQWVFTDISCKLKLNYISDEFAWSWTYITIFSLLFLLFPCIAGFVGAIFAIVIPTCEETIHNEIIIYVVMIVAFTIGQLFMWSHYSNSGEVLIVGNLIRDDKTLLIVSIISSIILAINTIVFAWIFNNSLGGVVESTFKVKGPASIIYILLTLIVPVASCVPLVLYSILLRVKEYESGAQIKITTSISILTVSILLLLSIIF